MNNLNSNRKPNSLWLHSRGAYLSKLSLYLWAYRESNPSALPNLRRCAAAYATILYARLSHRSRSKTTMKLKIHNGRWDIPLTLCLHPHDAGFALLQIRLRICGELHPQADQTLQSLASFCLIRDFHIRVRLYSHEPRR